LNAKVLGLVSYFDSQKQKGQQMLAVFVATEARAQRRTPALIIDLP
jgi:hypothetical protein